MLLDSCKVSRAATDKKGRSPGRPFLAVLTVTANGLRMCLLRTGAQSSCFSGLPFEVSSDAEDVRYAVVALVTCALKHHLIRPNHWDFRGPGARP